MKKITLTLLILTLSYLNVSAQSYNYNISYNELPKSFIEYVNLSYTINTSMNISTSNYLKAEDYHLFDVENYSLQVNISLPLLNVGNYSSDLILTTDNTTKVYFFNFNIVNLTPINYFNLDINSFEYPICLYTLPYNTTKDIVINSPIGNVIEAISSDTAFLRIENNFTMSTNQTIKTVNITLANLTIGVYEKKIRFNTSTIFNEVLFKFVIKECDIPLTLCNDLYRDMVNKCQIINKTITDVLECKRLEIEYDRCTYIALEDASQRRVVQNTTIEYLVNQTFVEALNINDPQLRKAIHDLPLILTSLQETDAQRQSRLEELNNQVQNLINAQSSEFGKLKGEFTESILALVKDNTNKADKIKFYQDKYISKFALITWGIIVLFILGIVGILIKYQSEYFI